MPTSRLTPAIVRLRRMIPVPACALAIWILALPSAFAAAGNDAKKSFDIPVGDAVDSLKQFSRQSGSQVIFPEDVIEGTRTREVKGAFTPAEAIDRLLSGTSLKAARDKESGSFAVSRAPDPRKEINDPNAQRVAQRAASDHPASRNTLPSLKDLPNP